MFPYELSFQAGDPQEDQVQDRMIYQQQDLIAGSELYGATNSGSTTITFSAMPAPPVQDRRTRGRGRGGSGGEEDRRKMQHREIERQRRQEMSALFSSLRSLLPLDYVKGKRSVSDHIAESAKYIKQLEGRIKELGHTRDQLLSLSSINHGGTTATAAANNVEVFLSSNGLQVQISCREDGPLLSMSLRVLLQAGLDVVSCVTNRLAGGALLHNIHCQVTHVAMGENEINVQQLQHRLYEVLSSDHTNTSTP